MFTWDTQDLDDPAVMEKEVADFKAAGGRSLVEMSILVSAAISGRLKQ